MKGNTYGNIVCGGIDIDISEDLKWFSVLCLIFDILELNYELLY